MKKLFLHIGFHKTGTSALQEYLSKNREKLIEQDIFYPRSFDDAYPGNVDLSWAFNPNPPKWGNVTKENSSEVLDFYKAQIQNSPCNNIIVSSEDFSLLDSNPTAIESIREYFSDYDVKLVAYVREPLDFVYSLYSHAVRSKRTTLNFKQYITSEFDYRSADFSLRLKLWRDAFGYEKLIVKRYSLETVAENSLHMDFFNALGIKVKAFGSMKKSNVGLHPWLIKSYIRISVSDIDELIKEKKLKALVDIGLGLPKDSAVDYLLEPLDIEFFRNSYKRANNILIREYGVSFD